MIIRRANTNDATAISNLIRGVAHYFTLHPDGCGAENFLRTVSPEAIQGYVNAPNFLYLAAFVEDELAGMVAVRDNKHLFHLFVAPVFQGRGIAKKLWTAARQESTSAGAPSEFTVVTLGSIDDDPNVRPERHVFVESKAPWYAIADSLPQFKVYPGFEPAEDNSGIGFIA